nr:Chain X, LAK160-P10 [synthetic construct]
KKLKLALAKPALLWKALALKLKKA